MIRISSYVLIDLPFDEQYDRNQQLQQFFFGFTF